MNIKDLATKYKVVSAPAKKSKTSALDESRSAHQQVDSLLYNHNEHRKYHPEVQQAVNTLTKLRDKHKKVVEREIAKLMKNPKPSSNFVAAVKSILPEIKKIAGSGVKIVGSSRSESKDNLIYTLHTMFLTNKLGANFSIYLYERWRPETHQSWYGTFISANSTSKGDRDTPVIRSSDDYKEGLAPKYNIIEDRMIESGFKTVRGKDKFKVIRTKMSSVFPKDHAVDKEDTISLTVKRELDMGYLYKEKFSISDSDKNSITNKLKEISTFGKSIGGITLAKIGIEAHDYYDGQGYSNYPSWVLNNDKVEVRWDEEEGTPKGWGCTIIVLLHLPKKPAILKKEIDFNKLKRLVDDLQNLITKVGN